MLYLSNGCTDEGEKFCESNKEIKKSSSSVSGILLSAAGGFPSFIWDVRHRTPPSANPSRISTGSLILADRDIHGLSTHKVYPPGMSPHRDVSSYLTFSPLPRQTRGGYFLWHLLLPGSLPPGTFPLGSMAPCVVPTFLTANNLQRDRKNCCFLQSYSINLYLKNKSTGLLSGFS